PREVPGGGAFKLLLGREMDEAVAQIVSGACEDPAGLRLPPFACAEDFVDDCHTGSSLRLLLQELGGARFARPASPYAPRRPRDKSGFRRFALRFALKRRKGRMRGVLPLALPCRFGLRFPALAG